MRGSQVIGRGVLLWGRSATPKQDGGDHDVCGGPGLGLGPTWLG